MGRFLQLPAAVIAIVFHTRHCRARTSLAISLGSKKNVQHKSHQAPRETELDWLQEVGLSINPSIRANAARED